MFIIRRTGLAQVGRRDESVAMIKEMYAEMNKELGMPQARIVTGSIGPSDSTIQTEVQVESLAEFEQYMNKANSWPGMAKYGEKLKELMVPGSGRFEVFRVHK